MSNKEIDYGEIISSMGSDKRKEIVNNLVDKEAKKLIAEEYSRLNVPIPSDIESSEYYDGYKRRARKNIKDKYDTRRDDVPLGLRIGSSASPLYTAYLMQDSFTDSGNISDIGKPEDFIKGIGISDSDVGNYAANIQMLNSLKNMGIDATELENMTPAELSKYTNPDLANLAKNSQNKGDKYLLQQAYNNAIKPEEVATKTAMETATKTPTNTTSNSATIPELTDDMFAPTNTIQSTTPRRRRISDLSDEERKKFVSSIASTMFNGLN